MEIEGALEELNKIDGEVDHTRDVNLLISAISDGKMIIEENKTKALDKLDIELNSDCNFSHDDFERPLDEGDVSEIKKKFYYENLKIETDDEGEDFLEVEKKNLTQVIIEDKVYEFNEKHGKRMTEDLIRNHCKKENLYQTPYLNDVLYLHYNGFSYIENLGKYTGLKCLWLENNGIKEIANLSNQRELRCLYLHNNLISKIENLEALTKLDTLNLSHNTIRTIENLDGLKVLNTLNLSHNYLTSVQDIEHLKYLDSLSVLDVSHNRIESPEVMEIFGAMKSLRVLTLMGNPVLRSIKTYRKVMILKCKNLSYLDDRPVFPIDRACALAWERGGAEEEMRERDRWNKAEQKKINDSIMWLINVPQLEGKIEINLPPLDDTDDEKSSDGEDDEENFFECKENHLGNEENIMGIKKILKENYL
ncbi:dynein axonemal assembly factor 1 [Microplitis mediator]|uniref:dynein axonemal assembly factor 1 n=1 Tax=Microplitis mediator TaxID=375433 RepID=UPI002557AFF1|nr:dynein axonemal assembly factor 1 [Microplitis mediator]